MYRDQFRCLCLLANREFQHYQDQSARSGWQESTVPLRTWEEV